MQWERKRSWKILAVQAKIIFSGTEYILCFVTKAWMEALGFTTSRLFCSSFPGTSGSSNSAIEPLGTTTGIQSLPPAVWGPELAGEHHPRPQSCPSCPGHDFQSSDLSLPFRARFYCCWVPHLNSRGLKWFPRHKVLLHSQVLEVKHPISTVWGFYLQGGLRLAWAHSRHPDGIRRASPGWLQLSSHNSISAEGLLGLGSVLPDDVRSALLWQMSAICTAAPASLGEGQKNNPAPLLSPRILSGAVLIPVRLDNQGQTPRLAIRGSLEPGIDKSGDKHIIPRIQLSSCSLPALQQPWPDVGIQHISLFPPSRFTKLSLPIAL